MLFSLLVLLMAMVFATSTTQQQQPLTLTLVMGPLCSGKTTYIEQTLRLSHNTSLYVFLNADALLDELHPNWNASHYTSYREEIDILMGQRLRALLAWPRQHIICETTGADHAFERILAMATAAKAAGYRVILRFHEVTPIQVQTCVRFRNRLQKRVITPSVMKHLYFESMVNFRRMQHRWNHLFDIVWIGDATRERARTQRSRGVDVRV